MKTRATQVPFFFGLLFTFSLATFQNVTIDDAVLAGPVVPQYLPNNLVWNIGNNCSACLARPDPSLAYNHTWHDITFSAGSDISPAIEFSFTGNGLYVFFIIANNVTFATTTTEVSFVLDGVTVSNYTHNPLATTDYEYNVSVFSNGSLEYGAHTMLIQPANTNFNTLMMFDYLIYTTVTTPSSSLSSLNIATIAGGTVGGVAAVLLVISSLLYYRRCKRHSNSLPPEGAVAQPFILSTEVIQGSGSTMGTGLTSQPRTAFLAERPERSKTGTPTSMPSRALLSSTSPSRVTSTAPAPSSRDPPSESSDTSILEQVRQLRHDVAHLLHLHTASPHVLPLEAPPPEYA